MSIENLTHIRSGKVRDIYKYDEDHLLFVTSDRVSAFDVVLPSIIPGKGKYLNLLSEFWMRRFENLIPNHLSNKVIDDWEHEGDPIVVKKLTPLTVEAIVRGYVSGSGWKDYQKCHRICGIYLGKGLQESQKLDEPIFTPSTKVDDGHDMNITFDEMIDVLREPELAKRIKYLSLQLYNEAHDFALAHGIIIADTKFEFGLDEDGRLHLIDEVLTSDSSRFWDVETYQVGTSPPSFDKQIVRNYLETIDWDKTPPGPELPEDIIDLTASRYRTVYRRLTTW